MPKPKSAKRSERTDPDALVLSPPIHGRASPLSKSQLCEWLHCSPKFVEAEVARGRLRPHKLSHRLVRFSWDEIDRWLASKAL
jgi:excisionase family DNA binding protein